MTRKAPDKGLSSRPIPPLPAPADYDLVLYISGVSENSRIALTNIKGLSEKYLRGRYRLKVVDLCQQPEQASGHDVKAVPMLVKELPLPMRRMVGALSNEERVLAALDLVPLPDQEAGAEHEDPTR